jgi:hypothetical protein
MTKKLFPILIAVFVTACICVLLAGGALLFPNIRSELELHPVYQVSDTFMLNLKLGRYEDAKIFLDDELAAHFDNLRMFWGCWGPGRISWTTSAARPGAIQPMVSATLRSPMRSRSRMGVRSCCSCPWKSLPNIGRWLMGW